MKELTIRLDDQTWAFLWAFAKRNCLSIEEAAVRCIKAWLNEVEYSDDPLRDPTVRRLLKELQPVVEAMERDH